MEFDLKDMDVVAWLAKLKSVEVQYPSDLFASRRLGYIRRVAEIGLGLGVAPRLKNTPKAGSGRGAATKVGGVFEAILLAAILVEASAAAYIYRDQIVDVIQSYTASTPASESIPPSDSASPLPKTDGAELPETVETPQTMLTNTPTTTATVIPTVIVENNEANDQPNSTPDPKGNNGNHYGQTPKPERTKDKGNNDNDGGKDKDR